MKEELEKICKNLYNWCLKHDKDYLSVAVIDGGVMANIDTEDKDYNKCNVYMKFKEEDK